MRFFHEKGAMLTACPKNNTKILLLSRRGKQTQEKMPPLTEKHKNPPKTTLSQTPPFQPHPPLIPLQSPPQFLLATIPPSTNPRIDVVDIGESTSTTSVNRRRRRRFRVLNKGKRGCTALTI